MLEDALIENHDSVHESTDGKNNGVLWNRLTKQCPYILITPSSCRGSDIKSIQLSEILILPSDMFLSMCQSLFAVPETPETKAVAVNTEATAVKVDVGVNTDDGFITKQEVPTVIELLHSKDSQEAKLASAVKQRDSCLTTYASTCNKRDCRNPHLEKGNCKESTKSLKNASQSAPIVYQTHPEQKKKCTENQNTTMKASKHNKITDETETQLDPKELVLKEMHQTLLSVNKNVRQINLLEYLHKREDSFKIRSLEPMKYLHVYLLVLYDFVKFSVGTQSSVRQLVKQFVRHLAVLSKRFYSKTYTSENVIAKDQRDLSVTMEKGFWLFGSHEKQELIKIKKARNNCNCGNDIKNSVQSEGNLLKNIREHARGGEASSSKSLKRPKGFESGSTEKHRKLREKEEPERRSSICEAKKHFSSRRTYSGRNYSSYDKCI